MLEPDSLKFMIAVGFGVAVFVIIIFAYAMHLLSSSRRLRQAQHFSSAVVEFAPELMIIVFDHENQVVVFNKSSEMLSGYSAKEILGKKAHELSFLSAIMLDNLNHDELNDQQSVQRTTATLKLKDGSERFIEWQIRCLRDDNGKIELKIASGLDITELKQAEEKLRALTANLSIAEDRERKRIAEELHDRIGEILIVSNHKIAEMKASLPFSGSGKALDELSQTIHEFSKGTRSLIFDLIPPVLYDIGLEAAIESLADHFKKQYRIEIRVENDQQEKPVDQDLAMFLYKAVRELLLNVVKHARAKKARIALCAVDGKYRIAVEDDGAGFEINKPSSQKNGGGFGLFSIKNQAEYYKGSLEIDSAPGKGSRCVIWIPLKRKTATKAYENQSSAR